MVNLSIVTINYNGSENTIKLLESLKNQTDKSFNVIVVDNNSDPNQKALLKNYRTEETNIIFIENDKNLGFSGGNNVGIKKVLADSADWVLLLNNDTWAENDLIFRLKAGLEGKEGIVGLAIDEAPTLMHECGGEGDRTAYAGKIVWLKPTLPHIFDFRLARSKMSYAIGGAMAIHRSVFDKIGFLDEKYFLYFEDADFSIRARKAGVPVKFLPEVKVRHSVSASTKKLGSPMILRYHYRNAFYFNLKNGPLYIKLLVWPWSWFVVIKQIFKIVVGVNKEQSKAILAGVMDFYGKKMSIIKAP